jgi:GT2 family glycosyltransferase
MNSIKSVPVIIAHFRNPEALKKTLEHVSQQTVACEVFVRDNSHDNIYFTKAMNEGLRKYCFNGQHDFVLLLNHDAFLAPDCVEQMVQVMLTHPKCGIVAPVTYDQHGNITFAGGLAAFPNGMHHAPMIDQLDQQPYTTRWANGACMLLRVAMVHEIGLMDENIQFVFSDSDYSFTARARGWDVMVAPNGKCIHNLNSSGDTNNNDITRIKWQDQLYFAEKWLTGDLYKKLSVEGSSISRMGLSDLTRKLRQALETHGSNPR